jgi:hypothetical protein
VSRLKGEFGAKFLNSMKKNEVILFGFKARKGRDLERG